LNLRSESGTESDRSQLSGWKAIASYLGKSIRTVQRWEREMELPIRRLEGPKGEVIFAFVAEIDQWMESRTRRASADDTDDSVDEPEAESCADTVEGDAAPLDTQTSSALAGMRQMCQNRGRCALVVFAILLTASALVFAYVRHSRQPQVSSLRIDQNRLIAYDENGRIAWQHVFPNGVNSEAYSLQGKEMWMGDVNHDGVNEILFAYHPGDQFPASSVLYCFAANGRELWHFVPGKKVRTATETFEPPFGIQSFKAVVTPKQSYVVVSGNHHTYYPAQVAVLSADDGHLMSEYWHSGHLNFLTVGDLNHDGKIEIYASGIDNEYRSATVVVLDLENAKGASRQTDARYQVLDMPLASELGRVYFPRSCVNRAYFPFNYAPLIVVQEQGITVQVNEQGVTPGGSTIEYILNPELKLRGISPHDSFAANHRVMELQGLLHHRYSQAEIESLADQYRNQSEIVKSRAREDAEEERTMAKHSGPQSR
jgi:hypothetical protein